MITEFSPERIGDGNNHSFLVVYQIVAVLLQMTLMMKKRQFHA